MKAIRMNHYIFGRALISLLLKAGADYKIKNKEGETALSFVHEKHRKWMMALIESYYKNPKSLLDICLSCIKANENFFADKICDFPQELKEKFDALD